MEAKVPPAALRTRSSTSRCELPNSTVTSLEGGLLWSTDLRLGPATTFGGHKTRQIAVAKGPIYINPFVEPSAMGDIGVTRTVGRVLGGGRMTEPLKLELVLDSESHARARSVVAAINGRFPQGAARLARPPAAAEVNPAARLRRRVEAEHRDHGAERVP